MTKHNYSFKFVNKLAVPAIVTGIIDPIISLTDAAVVGNLKNEASIALAAVGIAGSFIATLGWIFTQSKIAIAAIVAEYLGANKLKEIKPMVGQMLWINLALGVLLTLLTTFFSAHIFEFYNANGAVLQSTISYFKIRALGFPLMFFVITIFSVFRGLQNTFWPMVITLIGAFTNVVLDVIFVYGIPSYIIPMGINGAAWASLFAQVVMFVLSLLLLLKKTIFVLKVHLTLHPEFKRIFKVSLNMLIRTIALNVSLVLSNKFAAKYGPNTMAAFTIAFQLWLFFAYFIDGYAGVAGIVAGKLKGQGDLVGLKPLVKKVGSFTLLASVFLIVTFAVLYPFISKVFTQDTKVIAIFNSFFWIVLLMQPINAMAFLMDDVFKGLAAAKTLRNALILSTLFGFVPVLLVLDMVGFKIYAIWVAILVWMMCRASLLMFKFVGVLKTSIID